jgi:protein tyrosine phosphatase
MTSVNDTPNHFVVLDTISRGMKSVGKLAQVTRPDNDLVEIVVNDLPSQHLMVIAEKKGFFGGKKQRNND